VVRDALDVVAEPDVADAADAAAEEVVDVGAVVEDALDELADTIDDAMDVSESRAIFTLVSEMQQALNELRSVVEGVQAEMARKADVAEVATSVSAEVKSLSGAFTKAFSGLGTVLAQRIRGLAAETVAAASQAEIDAVADIADEPQTVTHPAKRVGVRPGFDSNGVPLNMPGRE